VLPFDLSPDQNLQPPLNRARTYRQLLGRPTAKHLSFFLLCRGGSESLSIPLVMPPVPLAMPPTGSLSQSGNIFVIQIHPAGVRGRQRSKSRGFKKKVKL
jgi:hypothetical protein